MAGLFGKGKAKLKQEIVRAQTDKGQKIESDKLIIEHNRVNAEGCLNNCLDNVEDLSLTLTDTRYNITLRDGSKREMSKQLIIDSICYNIMTEAPIYQRLVTIPMVFIDHSIPWHVSCNGEHTLLSEDILGKSFPDIVFLVLKEFVHVSLGHKIAFGFDTNVVMTEQRFAFLRLEKNILDNVVVLNGLLNNPLEYGIKENLADISAKLRHEAESLFNACGYSVHNNAWRSELTLYHVPAILEGDGKSFNSHKAKYTKDIQYELKPRKPTKQYRSENTINIRLSTDAEADDEYKPRSQKTTSKELGNSESGHYQENECENKDGEVSHNTDKLPNDEKSNLDDKIIEECVIPEVTQPKGDDDVQPSDKQVDAVSFGYPPPNMNTDINSMKSPQDHALEVTELLQDIMSEMSDLDLEQFVCQMDEAGIDMLDSNPGQMMDFIQKFLNEPNNSEITGGIPDSLKDRAGELAEWKESITPKDNGEQFSENYTDTNSAVSNGVSKEQSGVDECKPSQCIQNCDDSGSFENERTGGDIDNGNPNQKETSGQHSKSEVGECNGCGQSAAQACDKHEAMDDFEKLDCISDFTEQIELEVSNNISKWELPNVDASSWGDGDKPDSLDTVVSEADIESIKANLTTYFNQADNSYEQNETITVETEEYDFMNSTDYKNFLKDSMSYYSMFGAQETMTKGQYDTLRNELIASARNSHSEDGGFAQRLDKNEYKELFTSSAAWYQDVKKTVLMYKPSQHSSYQRPNKKYLAHNIILQGKSAKGKVSDVEQLVIFVDSSGSMTKQDMLIFKSVIKTCSRYFPKKVKAYEFNSAVFPLKVVNGYLREDPSHSGGTVIKTVLNEVGKLTLTELAKTLVIVVSDGEFAWRDVTEFMKNYTASKAVFLVTSVLRAHYASEKDKLIEAISSKRVHVFEVKEAGIDVGIRWG